MCWTEELDDFNNRVAWNKNVGGKNLENSIKVLDGINELVPSINKFTLGAGPTQSTNSKMIFPKKNLSAHSQSSIRQFVWGSHIFETKYQFRLN